MDVIFDPFVNILIMSIFQSPFIRMLCEISSRFVRFLLFNS